MGAPGSPLDRIPGRGQGEGGGITLAYSLFVPVIFGLVGSITPCALGINAVFLGYAAGKPRARRVWEWLLFSISRAALLKVLGLSFGLLGGAIRGFVLAYQRLIAWGLIALGGFFILSRFWRLPLPYSSLNDGRAATRNRGTLALGLSSDWVFRPAPVHW